MWQTECSGEIADLLEKLGRKQNFYITRLSPPHSKYLECNGKQMLFFENSGFCQGEKISVDEAIKRLSPQEVNILDMKPGEVGQVIDEKDLTGSIVMCFKDSLKGPQVYTVKPSSTAIGDSKNFPGPWNGGRVKLVNLKDVL